MMNEINTNEELHDLLLKLGYKVVAVPDEATIYEKGDVSVIVNDALVSKESKDENKIVAEITFGLTKKLSEGIVKHKVEHMASIFEEVQKRC